MKNGDSEFRSMRGRNVTSFPSRYLQEYRTYVETLRTGKCDVHWGGHSCDIGNTRHDQHHCMCGDTPQCHSVLWGTGLTEKEIADNEIRKDYLAVHELHASWADPYDKWGRYNPDRKRRGLSKAA